MGRTRTLLLLILPLFSQLQNFCSVTDQSRLTLLVSFYLFIHISLYGKGEKLYDS